MDKHKKKLHIVSDHPATPTHRQPTLWKPEGQSFTFEVSIIAAHAPGSSGVFGLHNDSHQIFIGEAANLRNALLRHRQDSPRLFQNHQPKYFSFQECGAESRGGLARALIATYQPALQGVQLLVTAQESAPKNRTAKSESTRVEGFVPAASQRRASADHTGAARSYHYYFSTGQLCIMAGAFVLFATSVAYLGLRTGQMILGYTNRPAQITGLIEVPESRDAAPGIDIVSAAVSGTELSSQTVTGGTEPNLQAVSAPAAETLQATVAPILANSIEPPTARTPPAPAANDPALRAEATSTKPKAEPSGKWTVQVSATQDPSAASASLEKLVAAGFDAFIVEAEVNGARWYRLRVGSFADAQSADAMKQALAARANLRNAFVTTK